MKNILFFLALACALASSACHKCEEPVEATLPDEVVLGETMVFLNGDTAAYLPEVVRLDTFNHRLILLLTFKDPAFSEIFNTIVFLAPLPFKTKDYTINGSTKTGDWTNTSFGQRIDIDGQGYTYELVDAEQGFFRLDAHYEAAQTVRGRFKAKFCRTSKNGNGDLNLPKTLLFQGVFNEAYQF